MEPIEWWEVTDEVMKLAIELEDIAKQMRKIWAKREPGKELVEDGTRTRSGKK